MAVIIVIAFMLAGTVAIAWLVHKCMRLEKEMRNGEGYIDTTAGAAIMAVAKEEQELARENHELIQEIRMAAERKGFEITSRITLRHKKSGRVFK